jgi:uridine kinase
MVKSISGLDGGLKQIVESAKGLLKTKTVVVIGIAGGSGSGKTHLSKMLSDSLGGRVMSMDDYYIGIDSMRDRNFDHPGAIEMGLLRKQLAALKQNKKIEKPVYDFRTHSRSGYEEFRPSRIIIIEGLFALDGALRDEIDIRVFIDVPEKTRFMRRKNRDSAERRRVGMSVEQQWKETVEPMYKKYVEPQKEDADIIIEDG